MENKTSKFKSRKFILTHVILILATALPIAFHFLNISDAICMTVLGMYGAIGGIYGVTSTVDKKINGVDQ